MTAPRPTFSALRDQPRDPLLALIAEHRADPRRDKIDVGVGVYRDETGATPVMRAVKAAEGRLLAEQATKTYLGAEGDARFTELLAQAVLGPAMPDGRYIGLQTSGGTGALRLGAELMARANPGAQVWVSHPTWPNHLPIFSEVALATRVYPYYDATTGAIAFDAMLGALDAANAGDIVLLHGCCHNPTGTQFTLDQWRRLAGLCGTRGLTPFIDLAYHGLGDSLGEDCAGARLLVESVPAALIAYSCDKNFGLYRDRVGALFVVAPTTALAGVVRANVLTLARSLWSMPPDHGAAVVRTILDDDILRSDWRCELDAMRRRLHTMRAALAAAHPALAPIAHQRGLFSLLPISARAVDRMRETHGIYMPADGRINVAGLNEANLARFVEGLLGYTLDRHDAIDHLGSTRHPNAERDG